MKLLQEQQIAMETGKRLLVIEPYYDGSHQAFLEGLLGAVQCQAEVLSLPARKWKLRMQVSAPWFVSEVEKLAVSNRWFDTVLCSTFVDVAVLRAMLSKVAGWNPMARFCTYFHENQFAYPGQVEDPTILQFAAINFNTALVSDRLAFNSYFNRDSFLQLSGRFLKKVSEIPIMGHHQAVAEKSAVVYPGLDFKSIDKAMDRRLGANTSGPPVIVWNHRWEHDKNPDAFFAALWKIKQRGQQFRLIILGQSFQNQPECFSWAQDAFQRELLHFGFAQSREQYAALLSQGDVVVSSSLHEFFGISILEAVRAGCTPLLPNRLSYPELFDSNFLYEEDNLVEALASLVARGARLGEELGRKYTDRFCWANLADHYHQWLFGA